MLLTKRTLHRIGNHRVTFGSRGTGLEFRIVDQGGGYILGSVAGKTFVDTACGTTGPNSEPAFTPQRREALGRALAERVTGGGMFLDDREEN